MSIVKKVYFLTIKLFGVSKRKGLIFMDTIIGVCETCGGTLWYVDRNSIVTCDTCDYEIEADF